MVRRFNFGVLKEVSDEDVEEDRSDWSRGHSCNHVWLTGECRFGTRGDLSRQQFGQRQGLFDRGGGGGRRRPPESRRLFSEPIWKGGMRQVNRLEGTGGRVRVCRTPSNSIIQKPLPTKIPLE